MNCQSAIDDSTGSLLSPERRISSLDRIPAIACPESRFPALFLRQQAQPFTIAVALVVMGTSTLHAAKPQWWRSVVVQRELHLTAAQIARIDEIFRSELFERRRLAREQEALETRLNAVLRDGLVDDDAVSKLVDDVTQAQARRNVSRTLMLFRIYRVLTPEQRVHVKGLLQRPTR